MYKLPEKIDAANAKTVEEELMKTRPVELDASSLSAVSSSGLRMLLRFSESLPGSLRLNDVSGEIYEILETTGFTEIWDVRKKPRQVEIDGLPLIGTGSWAKVYLLDEETVIKVYDSPNNDLYPDKAKYEADISREVFKRRIPTAISYNLVKCGTYDAGVYERITGPTLAEEMVKNPQKLEELMRQFADIGRKLHAADAPQNIFPNVMDSIRMPGVDQMMTVWLDEQEVKKWNQLYDVIPVRETLLHTDFQYSNVMIQNGEMILIDVGGAAYGHPILDFFGTYIWAYHPEIIRMPFPDGMCREAFDTYVKFYFGDRLTEENRPVLYDLLEFTGMLMGATMFALKAAAKENHTPTEDERKRVHAMFDPLFQREIGDLREKFLLADKELFDKRF